MLISAAPGSLLWPAAIIVWGPGSATSAHKHHCVQLVMAMRGTIRIRSGPGDEWMACDAALVRPDAAHEVDARDTMVLLAFVEPESELGAALSARIERDIVPLRKKEVAAWRTAMGTTPTLNRSRVKAWVRRELLQGRYPPKIHPGVQRVLRFLPAGLGSPDTLSLHNLASIAGLSDSRFMHVFTESVGVPVRSYILWLRLQRASGECMSGESITDAAHSAGFADAAHMTRTFRRMLGTTPSELVQRRSAIRELFVQSK
jgi:AraC-like DNA-binding protein